VTDPDAILRRLLTETIREVSVLCASEEFQVRTEPAARTEV
jgi:hypothetical protein